MPFCHYLDGSHFSIPPNYSMRPAFLSLDKLCCNLLLLVSVISGGTFKTGFLANHVIRIWIFEPSITKCYSIAEKDEWKQQIAEEKHSLKTIRVQSASRPEADFRLWNRLRVQRSSTHHIEGPVKAVSMRVSSPQEALRPIVQTKD